MDAIELKPIGIVRSPYATPLDAPRQGEFAAKPSTIELLPQYVQGLEGVQPGARLLVVWWAHQADRSLLARGDHGVFGGRAPHRPNPIAISEVELTEMEGGRLTVRGLDAVDGSPVLDLKSAHAEYEGWMPLPRMDADSGFL